jgi:hypothetical protein
MNPIVHAGVGWLIAQPLARRRDRLVVTAMSVLPDVDGLGLLVSDELYVAWHHRLAHGAIAAVVCALASAALARPRVRAALLGGLAFHAHVAMDLCGSGPQWPILYRWPCSDEEWLPSWQWDLASWQNTLFAVVVIALCLGMAVWRGRTPVELFSLSVDARVVDAVRARCSR